ncbi:LacI family DNA-binding transcriptional regulator [Steroidobacter flavus]|uniref:LacI family DNA-binding transcriptional regulator n=1 Tax=Steroidobacter flavus TaxID=1842136 RepID=A0ABV8SYT2_9GAMM
MTIEAVAQRAGVSAMTVSNVINDTGKMSAETRQAVQAAIAELGYTPNAAARALASAGATKIGIIYLDTQSAFLSAMLVGALEAAASGGAQVTVRVCAEKTFDAATDALRSLVRSGANALLIAPPFCEMIGGTSLLDELAVPAAALSTGRPLPDMKTVRIDDRAAATAMTELLLRKGHRRIGFISGPASHSSSAPRRIGYEAALLAHGIKRSPELIVPGDFSFESGLAAASQLLKLKDRPTAIFASNDDMAAAVISCASRQGLHIPSDLAVAGFDDTPIAVKIWPALTTIRQPIAKMAERCAALLIANARKVPQAQSFSGDEVIDFQLMEREST